MIPDITPVNTWAGNGSTTTFDFDFLINNDSELQVLHTSKDGFQTELKLNRDYTINQVGNENGSYITFPILGSSYKVLGEDEKISLVLNIPIAQSSPYGTSSKLNLKALEHSLDYIVRLIQIESRKNDRAVKVQEGSGISPEELIDSLRQSEINARDYAQTTIDKAQEAKDSADFAKSQADIATAKTKEVEDAYEGAIVDITQNSGALSYDRAMQYLYESQIAKICEAQYNEDANFKYLSPLLEDNIATYLYTAQGSRIDHIKWWLYNRFKYMDSKYIAADFRSNYLTMRLYTPTSWQDVEPNAEITVTPYIDQYVRVKYGAYDVGVRATHDNPVKITPPNIKFNDTETILYGADKITSIGSLAPLYAGTIDVSKAVKLSELIIGAGGNYRNTNLKLLTLGNNVFYCKRTWN